MTMIRRAHHRPELMSFSRTFDRLFDDSTFRPLVAGADVRLPLDVSSSEDAVTFEAALAGMRPEYVEITVVQNKVTIAVKEQEEHEEAQGQRVFREVRRSSGSRTLRLPMGMDTENAAASFENGMLRLSIPRAEEAKPRQIPVTRVTETPVAVAAKTLGAEDEGYTDHAQQA
mgnify:CR=1 FL=1